MYRWSSPVTVTPPAGSVITLGDAENYVRAPGDPTVPLALSIAVSHIEAITGLRLLTQTVRITRRDLPTRMCMPIGPVQSVVITYLDSGGATQTLDPTTYVLTGGGTLDAAIELMPTALRPGLKDTPAALTVTAVVGFGAAANVPTPIVGSILLMLGDLFQNREDTVAERGVVPATLPNGIDAMLANWRLF